MKQYQLEFIDSNHFIGRLSEFKEKRGAVEDSKMFFQIFSEVLEPEKIREVCLGIEQVFPEAMYMGCSTSGNIIDCQLSSDITVVCTVFEYASTRFQIYQYDLLAENVDSITGQIVAETEKHPWVKAMEMYFTIPEGSTTRFCDGMKDAALDIQIFGGVSCSDDITSNDCLVFSKGGKISSKSLVVIFYGGEEFYVDSIKVTGWKPLGRKFHVTKSDGCILHELDGILAYDVYHKYLNIKDDENFFYNTLEFPLFYDHNGTTILRTPVASNADGSITMTSDMDVGSLVQISYGDPST
ncbi:MAG: FIST C-terminal domain-containing protein, partial [Lachnospiraceae bacterium]|nr:FIST C-terminal domain-containing protein [Lachnospiraceae bacterium]